MIARLIGWLVGRLAEDLHVGELPEDQLERTLQLCEEAGLALEPWQVEMLRFSLENACLREEVPKWEIRLRSQ